MFSPDILCQADLELTTLMPQSVSPHLPEVWLWRTEGQREAVQSPVRARGHAGRLSSSLLWGPEGHRLSTSRATDTLALSRASGRGSQCCAFCLPDGDLEWKSGC